MAKESSNKGRASQLQAENQSLKAENKRLRALLAEKSPKKSVNRHPFRSFFTILLLGLAVALLLVGNILFWTGNTLVKTDRFVETMSPVVENTEVQKAVASYATEQLFNNVDVEQVISEALPPRAAFLVTPMSGQLQSYTDQTLQNVLANSSFQENWVQALERSHQRFISAVETYGSDGVIDVSEVYQRLSANLADTRLSFLADRSLPEKVGSVQVASGNWLSTLQRVIANIDVWRTIAWVFFILFAGLAIWLSRQKRRVVISLGMYSAIGMFATLISLRIFREVIADRADPRYEEAARQTAEIILNPLVVQTTTLLLAFLLVAFIAWVSGPTKRASAFKARVSDLFSGRLHHAIFGTKENSFTLWLGQHKRQVEWTIVGITALIALFVRLTPTVLMTCALVILVLVLAVETLAAEINRKVRA